MLTRCQVIQLEESDLDWEIIFLHWFKSTSEKDEDKSWTQGQDKIIEGLFYWLIPAVIQYIMQRKNSQDMIVIPKALFR